MKKKIVLLLILCFTVFCTRVKALKYDNLSLGLKEYIKNQILETFNEKSNSSAINSSSANTYKSSVKITNTDFYDNMPVLGNSFKIEDSLGNTVKEFSLTTDSLVINDLSPGKYYLVETNVEDGYVLNNDKIEFAVSYSNEEINVNMTNHIDVSVPNTGASRSALLLSIAMFDIAIGIGIFTYVKKNKVEE